MIVCSAVAIHPTRSSFEIMFSSIAVSIVLLTSKPLATTYRDPFQWPLVLPGNHTNTQIGDNHNLTVAIRREPGESWFGSAYVTLKGNHVKELKIDDGVYGLNYRFIKITKKECAIMLVRCDSSIIQGYFILASDHAITLVQKWRGKSKLLFSERWPVQIQESLTYLQARDRGLLEATTRSGELTRIWVYSDKLRRFEPGQWHSATVRRKQ